MGIFLAASLGCALPGTDPALGLLASSEFSHTIPLGIGPSLEVHPAMISGSPGTSEVDNVPAVLMS